MKIISIEVDEEGKVKVKYEGFIGEACFLEANKLYQKLKKMGININIEKTVKTKEYYRQKTKHTIKLTEGF